MLSTDTSNNAIFVGSSNNILDFTDKSHGWANLLYKKSLENFWLPAKYPLDSDILVWSQLSNDDQEVFKALIGYAIVLDSLQSKHIGNIQQQIKQPIISALLGVQQAFETIHSNSYSYISETLLSLNEKAEMYSYWQTDLLLKDRCLKTAKTYQALYDNHTDFACFVDALITNYILESIQFQFTFRYFELLETQNKLLNTAAILALIKRDEDIHVVTFQKLLLALKAECSNYFSESQIVDKIEEAIAYEKLFCLYITQNTTIFDEQTINSYFDWLKQDRLKALDIITDRTIVKNPLTYLTASSDYTGETVKANFFEASVVSYSMSSALGGWDF